MFVNFYLFLTITQDIQTGCSKC